jgi:alpha-tubulin suppressor-like RCC1 family protein
MDASPAQVEALTAKQIKKLAKRNEKDRLAKLAGSSQAIPSPIVQGGHKRGRADEEEDRDVLVKQPKKKKQVCLFSLPLSSTSLACASTSSIVIISNLEYVVTRDSFRCSQIILIYFAH